MGWFGTGVHDGDDPMDLISHVYYLIGVKYDDKYNILSTDDQIKEKLLKKEDFLYDWIRDIDWEKDHSYNPGFTQMIYIQSLIQLFLDYGIKISDRGRKGALWFIENDSWAKSDKERAQEMERLKKDMLAS